MKRKKWSRLTSEDITQYNGEKEVKPTKARASNGRKKIRNERVFGVKESTEQDEIQLRNQKKRKIKRGKQKLNVRERIHRV